MAVECFEVNYPSLDDIRIVDDYIFVLAARKNKSAKILIYYFDIYDEELINIEIV